jgi:uncharacterized protein involved in response to NO
LTTDPAAYQYRFLIGRARVALWQPFVWAALGLALTAGFAQGGLLFAAQALQLPLGAWWLAAAQAHGHVQLFGWAGLMVLGVGLHFIPRLRGAPLAHPQHTRWVLVLLSSGLVLRAVSQPWLGAVPDPAAALVPRVGLGLSGPLELAGVSLGLGLMGEMLRHGPSLQRRGGLWPVLPFFATAMASFWFGTAANATSVMDAALAGRAIGAGGLDQLAVLIGLYGFLVCVSVAMSARTFPLYFRTPMPSYRVLLPGLALLLPGLVLRAAGELAGAPVPAGLGQLALAAALVMFPLGLGVFAQPRRLPRQEVRPLTDPVHLHILSAYAWLLLAALLLVGQGLSALGVDVLPAARDAERHAVGAGFVTLLIFGMAVRLLAGFSGQPLRGAGLVWATLILGNTAAVLRVFPLVWPDLVGADANRALLATAGLSGLLAVAALALNLSRGLDPERAA